MPRLARTVPRNCKHRASGRTLVVRGGERNQAIEFVIPRKGSLLHPVAEPPEVADPGANRFADLPGLFFRKLAAVHG